MNAEAWVAFGGLLLVIGGFLWRISWLLSSIKMEMIHLNIDQQEMKKRLDKNSDAVREHVLECGKIKTHHEERLDHHEEKIKDHTQKIERLNSTGAEGI